MRAIETAEKTNQFSRSGDVWYISYQDETVQLPHLTGLEYIAILLKHAGKSLSSRQLEALARSKRAPIQGHDGGFEKHDGLIIDCHLQDDDLDDRARRELKARARHLEVEIQEARDVATI